MPCEWVEAPGCQADRVTLLYLHGGGYTIGSVRTHRALVARLASATGARALTVDYRLGPEDPFPAAVDDALAAYRWLVRTWRRSAAGSSSPATRPGAASRSRCWWRCATPGTTLPAAGVCDLAVGRSRVRAARR